MLHFRVRNSPIFLHGSAGEARWALDKTPLEKESYQVNRIAAPGKAGQSPRFRIVKHAENRYGHYRQGFLDYLFSKSSSPEDEDDGI
jgi:hypothetical protein